MSMGGTDNVREYYRLVTEMDIGDVARELLPGRITQESGQRLMCDCPNHQSQSRLSLHVMLDKQGWYCFGCGVGGDVLQLVEFIQTGSVTAGQSGPMPDSHRQARDYLAKKAGLPPLSRYGLSQERLAQTEADRAFELRVKDALTALAKLYHAKLKESPEVLDWLKSKYALSEETIDDLLIGYADNASGAVAQLTGGEDGFSKRELAATGAFRPTSQDGLTPFFERRIVFPYWSRGRVVFMIGRKTPWTPDVGWEQGKYKKLPVHDEHQRPYVADFINNALLFNEDCLLARPGKVIITEGVTDCLALMQLGLPTVSPVTVRIRAADWERLIPKLRGVETVYICQDNELSQAGLKGALQTARTLAEHKIDTRLVTLPLSETQISARQELTERFGLTASVGPKELAKLLAGRPAEEIQAAEALLATAKIDVNDYIAAGHTREDFERLLAEASTPIEFGVRSLPEGAEEEERNRLLEPILGEISEQSPLEQSRLLKLVQERIGGGVSMATLKEQIRAIQKDRKVEFRNEKKKAKRMSGAMPGSCRARVDEVLIDTELENGAPDYTLAAEAAYDWFTANGAQFFHTLQGEPFMYFDNAIYWMDSPDRGRKRHYAAMLYKHTGMVPTTGGGRTFFEVLPSLAMIRGQVRDHFSWLHTDVASYTVYFNLNNPEHEIAKITPDEIQIMKNGGNEDGIILDGSRKMKPLKFLPDADLEEADRLLVDLLVGNMTCPQGDRFLILSWLSCFLLIDFAGTRPMTRFEGSAGSGKTTASKITSTLLYGEPQHKKATDAANYTDGSQNPLIVLDNIEVKQMTEDLTTFMLTSITGIAKEKRKSGTDSETITERTKCLLNTTGIEPLCGELSEILSRSFVINFDLANQASDCFLESEVISAIQQNRDLIISAIMKRTSHVLAMIRDGAQKQVMRLLHRTMPTHGKRRCNDYLSLMYLMMLAGSEEHEVTTGLEELSPLFIEQIHSINDTSQEMARESNPIATALASLFHAYRNAVELDEKARYGEDDRANHVVGFIERYQVRFENENTMEPVSAGRLLAALRRVGREFNLEFEYKKPAQLGRRISNDLDVIRDAGFDIDRQRNAHTKNFEYRIGCRGV
jgi:hypothetical protein